MTLMRTNPRSFPTGGTIHDAIHRAIHVCKYVLIMYMRLESEFRVLEIAKAVYTNNKCAVIQANHWF